MDLSAVATYIGTIIGFIGIILPILLRHEQRLARIETKLDQILRFLNGSFAHGFHDCDEESRESGEE